MMSSTHKIHTEIKHHIQYNHNDNLTRWTSRECHEFMYVRPWQHIVNFYQNLVNGRLSLSSIISGNEQPSLEKFDPVVVKPGEAIESASVSSINRSGRWERVTFKILLSYHGIAFDGWQKQPGLNTVQGVVERSVGRFVDEEKAQKLKDKCLPLEGCVHVAGRTDKGVTALEQVCSFYTWRKDINAQDVVDAINEAAPGKLRVMSVLKVSREFHPNFSAKWRRYFYMFPLYTEENEMCRKLGMEERNCDNIKLHQKFISGSDACLTYDDGAESGTEITPKRFSIQKVNQLLFQLQGKSLSYKMFARDTKASRSMGPPTECIIYHVRATEATLPCDNQVHGDCGKRLKVMCIELVANRFLRRMVRVLVSTSIREAAAEADTNALLKLMDATCRRATAPPAPPYGLCLVDVGYEEFDPKVCLIP